MSEQEYAAMEGAMIAAVDEYMKARPQIDFVSNRRIYEAGFKTAYKQLESQLAAEREARQKAEEDVKKFMALSKANEQLAEIAQHRADRAEVVRERDELRRKLAEQQAVLRLKNDALALLTIGSCNCLTKTPEYEYHKMNCPYAIARQALEQNIGSEELTKLIEEAKRQAVPEAEWIPVEDELPSDTTLKLIRYAHNGRHLGIALSRYLHPQNMPDGFLMWDFEFGNTQGTKVTHWFSIPHQPHKD